MTTQSYANLPDGSTDANFRAWGSQLAAAMQACGVVQTTDTGQINWTTVTAPTVANTAAGYEIYRFNDAMQSSTPIFFKIEYALNPLYVPEIFLTIGTGSDGAGNLTGVWFSRTAIQRGVSSSTTTYTTLVSGDGSGLVVVPWYNLGIAGTGMMFSIERSRDSTGAATADGVVVFYRNGSGSISNYTGYQFVPGYGVTTLYTPPFRLPRQMQNSAISLLDTGGTVQMGQQVVWGPNSRWYSKMLLNYANADFAAPGTISVVNLGVAHTYFPVGLRGFGVRGYNYDAYAAMAILWE